MKISDPEPKHTAGALVLIVFLSAVLASFAIGILTWTFGWGVLLLFGAVFLGTFFSNVVRDIVHDLRHPVSR